MNWPEIDRLLAGCKKTPAKPGQTDPDLGDYSEFLRRYDGVEGFVSGHYLALWNSEQIQPLNDGYKVAEFMPGVVLFGSNGADTGFGLDTAHGRYISAPLAGMSPQDLVDLGASFEEFLGHVAAGTIL